MTDPSLLAAGGLLDPTGFMPRWACGPWTKPLAWQSIVANALIWAAYWSMPFQLIRLYFARKADIGKPWVLLAFAAFIFACGATHADDVAAFWWPSYRLFVLTDEITAALSVGTALILPGIVDYLIRTPSPAAIAAALESERRARVDAEEHRLRAERAAVDLGNANRHLETLRQILESRFQGDLQHARQMDELDRVRASLALEEYAELLKPPAKAATPDNPAAPGSPVVVTIEVPPQSQAPKGGEDV